ncbi:uncharacterized protein [Palaemon carinicauda]|uniref:uncharacterized protein n=1 Tax=Palaemon carinicauda TaxID=392227 RepID=UPI0035B5DA46
MFPFHKKKLNAIVLVLLSAVQIGAGLQCYFSEGDGSFKEIECSGSCIKIDVTEGPDESTSYGCDPIKYKINCTSVTIAEHPATVCFCDTDLCNGSGGLYYYSLPLVLATVILKFLI